MERFLIIFTLLILLFSALLQSGPALAQAPTTIPNPPLTVKCGDFNVDGKLSYADFFAYVHGLFGLKHMPQFCDFDGSSTCDSRDLRTLLAVVRKGSFIGACANPPDIEGDPNGDGRVSEPDYRFTLRCVEGKAVDQCPEAAKLLEFLDLSSCTLRAQDFLACLRAEGPATDQAILGCGLSSYEGDGNPVCGIDSEGSLENFSDSCEMQLLNAAVSLGGEADLGTFKLHSEGSCEDEPAACFCPEIYDPVCGPDGKTFGNLCELKCAGHTQEDVVHNGACGTGGGENQCQPNNLFGIALAPNSGCVGSTPPPLPAGGVIGGGLLGNLIGK